MQFSSLGNSKMEISEIDFFDLLTIQNNEISYVKHALALLYVFPPIFECWGGGAPKWAGAQPAYALFQPRSPPSPLRGTLPKAIEFLMKPVLGMEMTGDFRAGYLEISLIDFEGLWFLLAGCVPRRTHMITWWELPKTVNAIGVPNRAQALKALPSCIFKELMR